jgi:hypothetical protein
MVSRLVPISCEIFSWVIASRTRTVPSAASPESAVSSRNLANLSDRVRQPDGTHHSIDVRTISSQVLGGVKRDVRALLNEVQYLFPLHETQLARLHGFNRQLVRTAGDHGVQTENFTSLRDAHDQRSSVTRGSRELGTAVAEHKNPTGPLPLDEYDGVFRKNGGIFYFAVCFILLNASIEDGDRSQKELCDRR